MAPESFRAERVDKILSHGRCTTLGAANNIKNNIIMIKCFHDYPTMEESSAFISHSSMKVFKNATVGNTEYFML